MVMFQAFGGGGQTSKLDASVRAKLFRNFPGDALRFLGDTVSGSLFWGHFEGLLSICSKSSKYIFADATTFACC
jgi:hypothetical protein